MRKGEHCNWCGQPLRTMPPSAVVREGGAYPVAYHVQCKIEADESERRVVTPLVRRLNRMLRRGGRKALVAMLLALTPAVAHGQPLTRLGFTLDGTPGPGWVQTPLGVVTEWDLLVWRLTLRGVVPVAEILREREVRA